MPILNKTYTREEIHEMLGGDMQSYLPHKDGKVVCGCFRLDTNPDAPNVVLVGDGDNIYAYSQVFCEQKHHIPIFIKEDFNCWRYVGDYRVRKWEEDELSIKMHSASSGRTHVLRVLKLIKAPG